MTPVAKGGSHDALEASGIESDIPVKNSPRDLGL
jgi:hypothetical protein